MLKAKAAGLEKLETKSKNTRIISSGSMWGVTGLSEIMCSAMKPSEMYYASARWQRTRPKAGEGKIRSCPAAMTCVQYSA